MDCPNCDKYIKNPMNFCPYCREPLNSVVPPLMNPAKRRRKISPRPFILMLLFLAAFTYATYMYGGNWDLQPYLGKITSLLKKKESAEKPVQEPQQVRQQSGNMPPSMPEKVQEPLAGMEFVLVRGGCYQMGDIFGDGDPDEKPVHEVCIKDFYMSVHEVTRKQWINLMGSGTPAAQSGQDLLPMAQASWQDAQNFIGNLNRKSGNTRYRLPTEAEWEYACRSGGKKEKWAGTSSEKSLREYAWYGANSDNRPHPSGQAKPNALGLYDMSGNVWEWVEDDYAPDCYQRHERNDPVCTGEGTRTIRGGNWVLPARFARCTARGSAVPYENVNSVGFRVVRIR